ncbi:MAG: hypothetical protein AVDCRST_MAG52-1733, partial [uncultured Blastococcus sp.]
DVGPGRHPRRAHRAARGRFRAGCPAGVERPAASSAAGLGRSAPAAGLGRSAPAAGLGRSA